jgi:predicted membrane chloride channel (bestrophin family)
MAAGQSPFTPDKNHVHHRIMAMGFPQISTVLLLGLLNIVVVLFVINFYFLGNLPLIGILVAFSVVLSVFLGVYHNRAARRQVASS